MTVLKLELEIDSLAHPELHDMIGAIENESFRAERMRQLAATGLIWETAQARRGAGASRLEQARRRRGRIAPGAGDFFEAEVGHARASSPA